MPLCHVCTSPRQSTDEESGLRVNTRFHRLLDPWLLRQQLCNFARKEDADARRSTLMIDATTLTLSTQTINNKTRRRDQTQTRRPDADAQKPNMSSRNELRRRADCCAAHGNNNQAARAANPHMATLAVYTANNPDMLSGATATTTRLHAQPTHTWLR